MCVAEEFVGMCECLYVKLCAFSVLWFKDLWGDDAYAWGAECILDFAKFLIEEDVEGFVV